MNDNGLVAVTGADGFIGSHLVERLLADGYAVRALAQYNSFGHRGWLDEVVAHPHLEIQLGDVRDSRFISQFVRGADAVCHLAALIAIPYSYMAPESVVETNVMGTLNLLEAARQNSGQRLIVTSTSEVYGTPETVPISTSHPLKAQSPYAASKVAADQLTLSYVSSFEIPATIIRPFNTYGPRQSMRAVIPTILNQMLAGADEIRLGSLHPRRDFTYVGDTVEAFSRMVVAEVKPGSIVQLGTGETWTIADVVQICREITGSTAPVIEEDARIRPAASEVQLLLADPSQAREVLGWIPQTSLRDGLGRLAEWIQERDAIADVARYHV